MMYDLRRNAGGASRLRLGMSNARGRDGAPRLSVHVLNNL